MQLNDVVGRLAIHAGFGLLCSMGAIAAVESMRRPDEWILVVLAIACFGAAGGVLSIVASIQTFDAVARGVTKQAVPPTRD